MPGGRGRGRRRHRGIMNFLNPCLLVMLHRDKAHGYSLLSGLREFGPRWEEQDPSLIYRALRDMEEGGLVVSEWGEDSRGPQRRVYAITAEGENHLSEWMTDLHRAKQEIDALEAAFQQIDR
jgi:PadR family transcriptional regulator, regulatory protein PadR